MIGMALFAVLMCVNLTACGENNDEEEIVNKSTFELLKGVWLYDGDIKENYPYFIVEEGFCYFSLTPIKKDYKEKYKFTFDNKTNIMTCNQFNPSENSYFEVFDYFKVKSITENKLTLDFLNSDKMSVGHSSEFVRY